MTYNNVLGEVFYSFGDCIPYSIDENAATDAEVSKQAECFGYSDDICSSQETQPVIVGPGFNFLPGGEPDVPGKSAKCSELQ